MPFAHMFLFYQESPMPDPSELFTNVYVKGFGIEVSFMFPVGSFLVPNFLFLIIPLLGKIENKFPPDFICYQQYWFRSHPVISI